MYYVDHFIFLKQVDFVFLTDRYLWEKLLCVSQKRFHAAHEKRNKVCAEVMFPNSKGVLVCVSGLAGSMLSDMSIT